jgi:hypothetical protein
MLNFSDPINALLPETDVQPYVIYGFMKPVPTYRKIKLPLGLVNWVGHSI